MFDYKYPPPSILPTPYLLFSSPYVPTSLLPYLPTPYFPTSLPPYLPLYLPSPYLSTSLPLDLSTSLPPCLPTFLPPIPAHKYKFFLQAYQIYDSRIKY